MEQIYKKVKSCLFFTIVKITIKIIRKNAEKDAVAFVLQLSGKDFSEMTFCYQ